MINKKLIKKTSKGIAVSLLGVTLAMGNVLSGYAATTEIKATISDSRISGSFQYKERVNSLKITLIYKEKHLITGQVRSGECSNYANGGYSSVSEYRDVDTKYKYIYVKALGYLGSSLIAAAVELN